MKNKPSVIVDKYALSSNRKRKMRIDLPKETVDKFRAVAEGMGIPVEEYIAQLMKDYVMSIPGLMDRVYKNRLKRKWTKIKTRYATIRLG